MQVVMYGRFGLKEQMKGIEKDFQKDRTYINENEFFVIGKDFGKTIKDVLKGEVKNGEGKNESSSIYKI